MDWAAIRFWGISFIVATTIYLGSLVMNPERDCHWCKGRGKHYGWVFTYARHQCKHCNGGKVPRFGTKVWTALRGRNKKKAGT